MSYFSFLISPSELGVTSCETLDVDCDTLTPQQVANYVSVLNMSNPSVIHKLASRGKLALFGKTNTLTGYETTYTISEEWELQSYRYNTTTWLYFLKPVSVVAVCSYKNGLKKIAKTFLPNSIDADTWVRYNKTTAIFYLKQFSETLASTSLTQAIVTYTELFNSDETRAWELFHKWPLTFMNPTYRLYLKRHIMFHNKQIKRRLR